MEHAEPQVRHPDPRDLLQGASRTGARRVVGQWYPAALLPRATAPSMVLYPEKTVEQYGKGLEQADRGEYEAAIASYDAALEA